MDDIVKFNESLTGLITALSKVDPETAKLILIAVLALIIIFIGARIINKKIAIKEQRAYYDSMLGEKNKEIERLADDNRRYRDIYLPSLGLSPDTYRNISAGEV